MKMQSYGFFTSVPFTIQSTTMKVGLYLAGPADFLKIPKRVDCIAIEMIKSLF
jgi:hypothetical protein